MPSAFPRHQLAGRIVVFYLFLSFVIISTSFVKCCLVKIAVLTIQNVFILLEKMLFNIFYLLHDGSNVLAFF